MNPAPSSMAVMLASRLKDLLCGVEFYSHSYVPSAVHGFEPDQAEALFATETATYIFRPSVTVNYAREVFEMPSLSRNMGKQSNTVTVRLSNVPKSATPTIRPLALFVLNNEIEGMRMVVRLISRDNLDNALGPASWVLFVGKCAKADGFDRKEGSITAKQDLGQIEAMIPPKVFQKDCPLRFKGLECLGTEALGAKSATYQAATACNKTHSQCFDYGNLEFRQGIRVASIEGSFIHRRNKSFWSKLGNILTFGFAFKRRRIPVGSSTEDGTAYGTAIPIVLGRWQMTGFPLQYRDDGQTLRFLMAFARGRIAAYHNIRNNSPEFSQPIDVVEHYGGYGGEAGQAQDAVFPLGGFYSRLAYITAGVTGSDIVVEDPAPDISAMIAGIAAPKVTLLSDSVAGEGTTDTAGVYNFSVTHTDNPVDLALYVLTDPALLNFGVNFFDEERTAKTSVYTLGAVRDNTNAERLILPNTEIGKAGVDYRRYNSTSVIMCSGSALSANNGPLFAGAANEVEYEYYDPAAPPTSVALKTRYRKRFTCNLALTEQKKALDVLFDQILPTFRGYLSWDTRGRVAIRSERPADSTDVRGASIVGATTIRVDDVLPWKLQLHENNIPLIGKLLIGVGLLTSEVRPVSSAAYTADGNSITLAAGATGSVTATASGGTLTGGSPTVQASGTILIGGTGADNDTVTATINGEVVTYTLEGSGYNALKVANCLAFAINANPILQKYVAAHCPVLDDTVHIYSKQGVLTLSSALAEAHSIGEETIRVMMSFAGKALTYADTTRANILNGSFQYLGNDGQTRYNQFKGAFKDPLRDFADQHVIINDYDHQDQVEKIFPYEIDLSAVDNYWQASYLLNGANAKFGDGVDFFKWGSNGLALQLEEGDRVCVSDDSGAFRNVPVTIEALTVNSNYEVSFDKCRIYSTSMYDDFVEQTDVPLPSGLTNFASPPPAIIFNAVDFPPSGLIQTTTGTAGITSIRGGAIFGASIYAQYANVRVIVRAGVATNELVAVITPDSSLEAIFEFIASVDGIYTVELEVCNQWGCNTTKPTATIIIGFGANTGITTELGELITQETAITDIVLQE